MFQQEVDQSQTWGHAHHCGVESGTGTNTGCSSPSPSTTSSRTTTSPHHLQRRLEPALVWTPELTFTGRSKSTRCTTTLSHKLWKQITSSSITLTLCLDSKRMWHTTNVIVQPVTNTVGFGWTLQRMNMDAFIIFIIISITFLNKFNYINLIVISLRRTIFPIF